MAAAAPPMVGQRVPTIDKKKYQTIFPQYIDANLGPKYGRRLTKTQSVESPTLEEMVLSLRQLGYTEVYVNPRASLPCAQSQLRQVPAPRGAIKVAIKLPADAHYIKKSDFDVQTRDITVEGLPNKSEVLRRMAEIIKTRVVNRPQPINMTPAHQPKEGSGNAIKGPSAPAASKRR
ncbi:signal recognition particle 19, putative [Bodo saltans]|uniref:Signal recognition particle 19, putative n=1 Tax=Bodo saltans TaxID=75058 RepID=A0A0S4J7U0_BODSA|nr:signal recognition particle 19, putative [Bodo saltans]|eukprot:CUG87497.1 signal recognition particle 19, putative [Bodo saltans]